MYVCTYIMLHVYSGTYKLNKYVYVIYVCTVHTGRYVHALVFCMNRYRNPKTQVCQQTNYKRTGKMSD